MLTIVMSFSLLRDVNNLRDFASMADTKDSTTGWEAGSLGTRNMTKGCHLSCYKHESINGRYGLQWLTSFICSLTRPSSQFTESTAAFDFLPLDIAMQ